MSVWSALRAVDKALKVLALTEGAIAVRDRVLPNDQEEETMSEDRQRTPMEEIEVEAQNLVDKVKELLHQGNIRTLRIKDPKGRYLFEVPLTVGVLTGGIFAVAAPWMVALTALAGVVSNVKIEIVRSDEGDNDGDNA